MEAHLHKRKPEKDPALFSIQTTELWIKIMPLQNEGYRTK